MKIKVLTIWTPNVEIPGKIVSKNLTSYCEKYDYEFIEEFSERLSQSDFVKLKFKKIQQYLKDCDWLFWVDPVNIIMNSGIKLESFLNTESDIVTSGMIWRDTSFYLMTTNFFIRNSEWSRSTFFSEFLKLQKDLEEIGQAGTKKIAYWIDGECMTRMQKKYPEKFNVLATERLFSNVKLPEVNCQNRYEVGNFILVYTYQLSKEKREELMKTFEFESEKLWNKCLPPSDLNLERDKNYLIKIGALI